MRSILLEDKSIENFEKALKELQENSQAIIIFSCAKNDFTKEAIDSILQACSLPIIGGIFPAIIYQSSLYDIGTILLGLDNTFTPVIIHDISNERDYDTIIEEKLGVLDDTCKTMFTFFDGISNNIDTLVKSLFYNYGLTLNYVGGSAGYPDFVQRDVVMTNEGLLKDVAVFATTHAQSTIGVKHGWQTLDDTLLQITKSDGNWIHEIDYRPAYEVYREFVESRTNRDFDKEDFFDISKNYPLGITRLSSDVIVRVPNQNDGHAIACTGDVLENAYVHILHAKDTQLIEAAKEASIICQNNDYKESFKLYIGCLARYFVLDKNYHDELEAIQQGEDLLIGALALGEIANNQDYYLEFYNATAVVAQVDDAL